MKPATTHLATALFAAALGMSPAIAAEPKTWYVYCEGEAKGDHWAVFSENFWPHPMTEGYGRRVGHAAKAFFEARHDLSLEGCAAVNFVDTSLAQHSRSRTAQLHQRMGDRVLYFPLPSEALPKDLAVAPASVSSTARPAPVTVARAGDAVVTRVLPTDEGFLPKRAER